MSLDNSLVFASLSNVWLPVSWYSRNGCSYFAAIKFYARSLTTSAISAGAVCRLMLATI